MRFIPLHTTNTAIVYKNSLCSFASLLVLAFIALSVMLPVLLVSLLSPYSGISESRVLYEQPNVAYNYQYIFDVPARLMHFDLVLFFDAHLQHKCDLSPPSVLAYQLQLPPSGRFRNGRIQLKGELQLKQYVEFTCPFPGRDIKTKFRPVHVETNASYADMSQYKIESLMAQIKANPAYFQLSIEETYYRPTSPRLNRLSIELELDVLQVPGRYHLSIWERLGQFWLYFASFFGISFYIVNKVKDFLFGRHIIRSWEIIPWKKLY
ncbi:GL25847 [Drosophila persimilis]|uniref:Transmembrane protein 231 n=1 Tax=Drosophila persimilis TaxID=7234 RepID=B4GJL6_DROPE|nr:GL25847 [Drosophila persimilis]